MCCAACAMRIQVSLSLFLSLSSSGHATSQTTNIRIHWPNPSLSLIEQPPLPQIEPCTRELILSQELSESS